MSNTLFNHEKITENFFQFFQAGNFEEMAGIMATDMRSYITNAKGGVDLLIGRNAFVQNLQALDVKTVKPIIQITQMIPVKENQVMVMIEINAQRKNKSLHNFATFLLDFKNGLINELRMVEALPAYSDEFWKN